MGIFYLVPGAGLPLGAITIAPTLGASSFESLTSVKLTVSSLSTADIYRVLHCLMHLFELHFQKQFIPKPSCNPTLLKCLKPYEP